MKNSNLPISDQALQEFCATYGIRRLAVFGSVLRDDFRPESDVDVLVEFVPDEPVGLIRLGTVEAALSDLIGRRVDMNLAEMISTQFRDEVLAKAETLYDAA